MKRLILLRRRLMCGAPTHALFLLVGIPAAVLFSFIVPPGWGLDEQVHIGRAYQISEGNLYPDRLNENGSFGGELPVSLVDIIVHGHAESNSVPRGTLSVLERQDIEDHNRLNTLRDASLRPEVRMVYDFGPTGPYSPLVYAGSATGFKAARILDTSTGNAVIAAKLGQAVLYFGLVFAALYVLRQYRARWIVFTLAVLPSSIYQAATINADSFSIAAMLLFFAVMFRLFTAQSPTSRRMIGLLVFSSFMVALTKPSYAVVLLMVLCIPSVAFSSNRSRIIVAAGAFLSGVIALLLTTLRGLQFSDTISFYRDAQTAADISLTGQVLWTVQNPFEFISVLFNTVLQYSGGWQQSVVGLLGYNAVPVPIPLTILAVVVILLTALYSERLRLRDTLVFTGLGLTSVLAAIFLLYASFNPVGASMIMGVQGRYFIPSLAFILVGARLLLPIYLTVPNQKFSLVVGVSMTVVLYSSLALYIMYLY